MVQLADVVCPIRDQNKIDSPWQPVQLQPILCTMYTKTIQLTVEGRKYEIQLEYELGVNCEHVWATGTPTPPISYGEYLNNENASLGKQMLRQDAAWYYWRGYPEEYWAT